MSSNDKHSKQPDDDDCEKVTLSGDTWIGGVGYVENPDGTKTYYPKTTVQFFTPHDYKALQENLPADELALLEKNLVAGISDKSRRAAGLPEADPEWKKACDLSHSIKQASDKEYLFIAKRHLEKAEVVAVAHISLGPKDTDVAESYPARISVRRQVTLDVCRGKSERALRKLLSGVHDFFAAWASFQIQVDKAQHGGLSSLSCHYTLRLPVVPAEGLESKVGKVKITENNADAAWMRPTAQMCKEWGYEKEEQKGMRSGGTNNDETVVIVCEEP